MPWKIVINDLDFFFLFIICYCHNKKIWREQSKQNMLQLTSSLLISMKGEKETSWNSVLNVCAVCFKDNQSMRYCIQLHIIMCKRKTLILMFFTSLLYNLKLRLYRIREKKMEHFICRNVLLWDCSLIHDTVFFSFGILSLITTFIDNLGHKAL